MLEFVRQRNIIASSCRETSVLSLVGQLFRMKHFAGISFSNSEHLSWLLEDGESPDVLDGKPEDVLVRWVQFHLHKAGYPPNRNRVELNVRGDAHLQCWISMLLCRLSTSAYYCASLIPLAFMAPPQLRVHLIVNWRP
jgi:hypothetical protein